MTKPKRPIDPVATVMALTVENGGGTFEVGTYLPFAPKTGYAVGLGGVKLASKSTRDTIAFWLRRVGQEHEASFDGTWLQDDTLHLDAVSYVTDRDRAIELGKFNRQLAVYDFSAGESISL